MGIPSYVLEILPISAYFPIPKLCHVYLFDNFFSGGRESVGELDLGTVLKWTNLGDLDHKLWYL